MARGLLVVALAAVVAMGCGPQAVEAVAERDGVGTVQVRFSPAFQEPPRVELEQLGGCPGQVVAVFPQGVGVLFYDPALVPCSGRNVVRVNAYRR